MVAYVAPTDNSYDIYVGMKGKLANAVSFNVRGGINNEKNNILFGFCIGGLLSNF